MQRFWPYHLYIHSYVATTRHGESERPLTTFSVYNIPSVKFYNALKMRTSFQNNLFNEFPTAIVNLMYSKYMYNVCLPQRPCEEQRVNNKEADGCETRLMLKLTRPKMSAVLSQLCCKLLPTAACVSRLSDETRTMFDSDNIEDENAEHRLPGVRRKGKDQGSQHPLQQNIGEVEVKQWLAAETGMDRVRNMYALRADGSFLQEDTRNVNQMFMRTIITGFFINMFMAAQKEAKNKSKSLSKTQAMMKGIVSEKTAPRIIFKGALKNTFQLSIFAASMFHLSQIIATYRNKSSPWEYSFSAAVGFGAANITGGLHRCARFTVGGAIAGTLAGVVVCHVLNSTGLSQEQRHSQRIRQNIEEQRLSEKSAEEEMFSSSLEY